MQNNAFKDKIGDITFSIEEINKIRNQFIHYLPLQWSIETQHVVNVLTDTMKVISFLTMNCIEVQRHYEEHQLNQISEAIESCNSILLSYGGLNNEA